MLLLFPGVVNSGLAELLAFKGLANYYYEELLFIFVLGN